MFRERIMKELYTRDVTCFSFKKITSEAFLLREFYIPLAALSRSKRTTVGYCYTCCVKNIWNELASFFVLL